MGPFAVVVGDVFRDVLSEVPFPERHETIKALPFDGSHEALRVRIGIRGAERCLDDLDAGPGELFSDGLTPSRVTIADQDAVVEDPEIVVRHVGKRWASIDVSQREDSWHVGLQAIVHCDRVTIVQLQSGPRWIERVTVRNPPSRHEYVRAHDLMRAIRPCHADNHLSIRVALHALHRGFAKDLEAVFAKHLPNRFRDVRVLARHALRLHFKHGYPAAEPLEHLPELEADEPSADHDQMIRHLAQLHDGLVVQRTDPI